MHSSKTSGGERLVVNECTKQPLTRFSGIQPSDTERRMDYVYVCPPTNEGVWTHMRDGSAVGLMYGRQALPHNRLFIGTTMHGT